MIVLLGVEFKNVFLKRCFKEKEKILFKNFYSSKILIMCKLTIQNKVLCI